MLISTGNTDFTDFPSGLEGQLWHKMVKYYDERLVSFGKTLLEILNEVYNEISAHSTTNLSEFQQSLSKLSSSISCNLAEKTTWTSFPGDLVIAAHQLWVAHDENDFLAACDNHHDLGISLKTALGFFARLRECFEVIVFMAKKVPQKFKKLKIKALTEPEDLCQRDIPQYSLQDTLDFLGKLELSGKNMKPHKFDLGGDSQIGWLFSDDAFGVLSPQFDNRQTTQKTQPTVHAELQLVLHVAKEKTRYESAKILPYIGLSKYSCSLCGKFLDGHGGYRTRGCHSKIYSGWTVSKTTCHCQEDVDQISSALKDVENTLRSHILSGFRKSDDESSIGEFLTPRSSCGRDEWEDGISIMQPPSDTSCDSERSDESRGGIDPNEFEFVEPSTRSSSDADLVASIDSKLGF